MWCWLLGHKDTSIFESELLAITRYMVPKMLTYRSVCARCGVLFQHQTQERSKFDQQKVLQFESVERHKIKREILLNALDAVNSEIEARGSTLYDALMKVLARGKKPPAPKGEEHYLCMECALRPVPNPKDLVCKQCLEKLRGYQNASPLAKRKMSK